MKDKASIWGHFQTQLLFAAVFSVLAGWQLPALSSCDAPPSGLVSWWPGEGNANDIIGTNNGTAQGALHYTNGEVGQAFVFDGSTSYITVPPSTTLDVGASNGFTIECWIKPNSFDTKISGAPIIEWDSSSTDGAQFWSGGALTANIKDTSGTGHTITWLGNLATNNFQHVALTYDKASGNAFIYYNGVAVTNANFGNLRPQTTYPMNIGRRTGQPVGNGDTYGGLLDELSLYNRALTSNEIKSIYNAGTSGKCNEPTAPSITNQPTNQTANIGQSATFSVTASGTSPLSYQWLFNKTNAIAGATNASLSLNNIQSTNAGLYSVVVSNVVTAIVSSNATLTVNVPPPCVTPPPGMVSWWPAEGNANDLVGGNNGTPQGALLYTNGEVGQAFVLDGSTSYISVPASPSLNVGAGNGMTVEGWIKPTPTINGGPIVEWDSSSLAGAQLWVVGSQGYFVNLQDTSGDGHEFYTQPNVVNTNAFQHVALTYDKTSGLVILYTNGVPLISTNMGSFTPQTSYPLNLGRRTGEPIGNGDSYGGLIDELSLYNRALSSNEVQSIYAAGTGGKCNTPIAPSIVSQPTNQTVMVGQNATFSVFADGTIPLSYQWLFDNTNVIAGATNASLTLTNLQSTNAGLYSVVVSNTAAAIVSSNATLTVNLPPPPPPCVSAPSGLVSWWRAENNALDEVSTNNGSLNGSVGYTQGEVGQAFQFNAAGEFVSMGNPSNLQLQNLTIEAWVKRSSTSAVSFGPNGGAQFAGYANGGYAFWIDGSGYLHVSVGYQIDLPAVAGAQITDTNYHHVAFTKSGTNVFYYLDGVGYLTAPLNANFTFGTSFAIGSPSDGQGTFDGAIDEVAVYNRALSSNEIQSIYAAGSSGKCFAPVAPSIASPPANQAVVPGQSATFSVSVTGTQPFSYQWLFNNTNAIAGATNASFTLNNVQSTNAGLYSVAVSNVVNGVISSNAVLTVYAPGSCAAAPSGLVSWWRAEDNALDAAGTNNGTLNGSVGYTTGEVGQAFLFTAAGQFVSMGNPTNLQLQNLTIEAWVKRSSTSVVSFGPNGGAQFAGYANGGYAFWIDGSGYLHVSVGYQIDLPAVAGAQITDTNYHHVAFTKSGTNVFYYLDGIGYLTAPLSANFTFGTSFAIGSPSDGQGTFNGAIDEVSVYNRALTSTEIQSIYSTGTSGKCYPIAPFITSQPANQAVLQGQNATFSVSAAGTAPLSYQWLFDGTNTLNGDTNALLTLTNVQTAGAGIYSVVVSNAATAIVSSNATLTVNVPPPCVTPPPGMVSWWPAEGNANDLVGGNNGTPQGALLYTNGEVGQAFVLDGSTSYISVPASPSLNVGAGNGMTVEGWIKPTPTINGGPIVEWDSSSLAGAQLWVVGSQGYFVNLQDTSGDGHEFYTQPNVVNTNAFQHVALTYDKTSGLVILYTNGVPLISTNMGSFTPQTSYPLNLGRRTGEPIGNGDSYGGLIDELSLYNRALSSNEVQSIYAAGTGGKCNTPIAPSIVSQPTNQTVMVGQNATFSVFADGTIPLSYQWLFDNTNVIAGATNASLTLTNLQSTNAGLYSVVVSNTAAAIVSSNATLTVNLPPPPPPCVSAPSGLVSWWPAEGNANDLVGGNNGTLNGNVTYTQGEVGQAFLFTAAGQYVSMGNPANLQLQNLTIEAWVKRSSTSLVTFGPNGGAQFAGDVTGGYAFWIDSGGYLRFSVGYQIDLPEAAGAQITDTNYHHVAVTKSGTNVVYYLDGNAYPTSPLNATFVFTSSFAIGGPADGRGTFDGAIDETAVYNRALASNEIQSIYAAGASGKCNTPIAPSITTQPVGQTVTVGQSATFSVSAAGSQPFSYQWLFNNTNVLNGATNSSLTLTNVQVANAGLYSVTVSNVVNGVVSSNATLTVNLPPANIRVLSTNGIAGGTVTVPILLVADGNENSLSFSLNFDTTRLSYTNIAAGPAASGAILLPNYSQVSSGHLGVTLGLTTGATFAPGTNEIVDVTFYLLYNTNTASSTISFGDAPTARQLSDTEANVLPATYTNGAVSITPGEYEADVTPRPNGGNKPDGVTDWVQVGRFVAGLDTVSGGDTNGDEFQRADCAPRSTLGDGKLDITDWVQAGRYAAGLDPMTPAGGPAAPIMSDSVFASRLGTLDSSQSEVVVNPASTVAGIGTGVSVSLISQGDENGVGFTLTFDPTVFMFTGYSAGSGASGALLLCNTNFVSSGEFGVALALPSGTHFNNGTFPLIQVNLQPIAGTNGSFNVGFADSPVSRSVSDDDANELSATYIPGAVSVVPPPALTINQSGTNVTLSWPAAVSGFTLQSAGTATSTDTWANASAGETNGLNLQVTVPATNQSQYFRLYHP